MSKTFYKCPKCGDTGFLIKVDDEGYRYAIECECLKARKSLQRLERSGLSSLLDKYTFDRYTTKYAFQKDLFDKAQRFLKERHKWFCVLGESGCVDCDTEYFNGQEWKHISDYDGKKVLQYNPKTKEASLIQPFRYIKEEEKELYRIRTYRGSIDMCLSLDHNVAYLTSKGNMTKKPLSHIMERHNNKKRGFYGRIETAFSYNGGLGVDLTEDEIRLMVAVIADGYFREDIKQCRINVKKERKKERLRELLKDRWHKEYKRKNGYSVFMFYAPRREKEFTAFWYGCSYHQLEIIKDEVFNWDGHVDETGRKSFYSTSKLSADFIQFAISATGSRATLNTDNRINGVHKNTCYVVIQSKGNSSVSLMNNNENTKANFEKVLSKDGYKYCFTVETGYLVLRRNGRIFITGNCGKSHICTAICGEFLKQGKELRFMSWLTDSVKLKQNVNNYEIYEPLLRDYKNCEVLYVDDLFKSDNDTPPTPADIKLAMEIFNYRYNNGLTTIISGERLISQLLEYDTAIAGRIIEMSEGYLTQLTGREKNYRLKDWL